MRDDLFAQYRPVAGPAPGYGRQVAIELEAMREKAGGDWPTRREPLDDGVHVPGLGAQTWEGLARMAAARVRAGVALTELDEEALRRAGTEAVA